jgi:hypothetical protein
MSQDKGAIVKSPLRLAPVAVAMTILSAVPLLAGVVLPTDLATGSQYQLAFITAGRRTALITDIADYNAFVNQEAQASSSQVVRNAAWSAIASTDAIDAINNARTYPDIPIYDTQGHRIADNGADLWDGTLATPIYYDQSGNLLDALAWTGTNRNGLRANLNSGWPFSLTLGSYPYDASTGYWWTPVEGFARYTDANWVQGGYEGGTQLAAQGTRRRLYAISNPLTAAPEPSTLALLGAAVLGLGGYACRQRKRDAVRSRESL